MAAQEAGLQCAPTQPCRSHRSPLSPPFLVPHCPHPSWASLSRWKIQFLPQNTQTLLLRITQFHPWSPGGVTWAVLGKQLDLMVSREFFQPQNSMIPHYPPPLWPFLSTGTCSRFPFLRKYPSHLGTTHPYPCPRSHWSSWMKTLRGQGP